MTVASRNLAPAARRAALVASTERGGTGITGPLTDGAFCGI